MAVVAARARAQIVRARLLSIAAERAAGAAIGVAVQRAVRAHPDGTSTAAAAAAASGVVAEFDDDAAADAGGAAARAGALSRLGAALAGVELPYALGSALSTAGAVAVVLAAAAALHFSVARWAVPRA